MSSITRLSSSQLIASTTPTAVAKTAASVAEQPSPLGQDQFKTQSLVNRSDRPALLWGGVAGSLTGAATGAGIGYLIPTPGVGSGIGLGSASGAVAGAAAGFTAGVLTSRWIEGKTASTFAGAGVGAVTGALAGMLMNKGVLGGNTWMGAVMLVLPGAVAGAVGGFTAAALKK